MPNPSNYADDYPLAGPSQLRVRIIGCLTPGVSTDVSDFVERQTVKIQFNAASLAAQADFDVVIGASGAPGGYNFASNGTDLMEVRIDDPTVTDARYFGGFIVRTTSHTDDMVTTKRWTLHCEGYGLLLDRMPKPITTLYGGDDGTPVIYTSSVTPITSGSTTFSPRNSSGLYVGQTLFASNADGTNRERITLTGVSGVTATATFGTSKLVADTTGTISAAGVQTITPVSMTGITVGAALIIQNSGGTNEESVTVTAITPGSNFTATFASAHGSGALIKVRWYLSGGISDQDLIASGFSAMVGTTLTRFNGLLDDYYSRSMTTTVSLSQIGGTHTVTPASMQNIVAGRTLYVEDAAGANAEVVTVSSVTTTTFTATFAHLHVAPWTVYNGPWVNPVAVTEIIPSLPHLKFENTTARDVLQQVIAQNDDSDRLPVIPLPGTLSGSTPQRRTVTVSSTSGIVDGKVLRVTNADNTQSELITVEVGSVTSTTFIATFALTHNTGASGLKIYAGRAPRFYVSHDANWNMMLRYFDAFDALNNLTSIELTDLASIDDVTQGHYSDYQREIDDTKSFGATTVYNPNTLARGEYRNSAGGIKAFGAVLYTKPVVDSDARIQTNADAILRAQQMQQSFGKTAERIHQIVTPVKLSDYLLYEPHVVKFTNSLEGGTPNSYAITNVEVDFDSDGMPLWTLEIGDAFEELGDKPQPIFGSAITRDNTPPAEATWPGGTSWILQNTYNPYLGVTTFQFEWNANTEADMLYYWVQWYYDGEVPWLHTQRVEHPGITCTTTNTPNTNIHVRVIPYDDAGNHPDYNLAVIQNATLSNIVAPNPPTSVTVASNVYDVATDRAIVGISWTASTSGGIMAYNVYLYQGVNLIGQTSVPGSEVSISGLLFTPGATCHVDVQAIDLQRNASTIASTGNFVAGVRTLNPPSSPHLTINEILDTGTAECVWNFTASSSPQAAGYLVFWQDTTAAHPIRTDHLVGHNTTRWERTDFVPNHIYQMSIVSVDAFGNQSSTSTTPQNWIAAGNDPGPTRFSVINNPGFELLDQSDDTALTPLNWTIGTQHGGSVGIDASTASSGTQSIKMSVGATAGSTYGTGIYGSTTYGSGGGSGVSIASVTSSPFACRQGDAFHLIVDALATPSATLQAFATWYNQDGKSIQAPQVGANTSISNGGWTQYAIATRFPPPVGAAYGTLTLQLSSAFSPNAVLWLDQIDLQPLIRGVDIDNFAVGGDQIAPAAVQAGHIQPFTISDEHIALGGLTNPVSIALQQTVGNPRIIYDDTAVQRGIEFYDIAGWLQQRGVFDGSTHVGWKVSDDTGASLIFLNAGGSLVQGAQTLLLETGGKGLAVRSGGTALSGSWQPDTRTITADTTLDDTYHHVLVDTSVGFASITLTLPAASSGNYEYWIKLVDTTGGTASTHAAGSDTIEGNARLDLLSLYSSVVLSSNGVDTWYVWSTT